MNADLLRLMFPKVGPWHSAQYGRLVGTMLATPMITYMEMLKWWSIKI